MKLSDIHFKAIGLLEVLNSLIIVQLSVFRLEQHGDQEMNGDGKRYHLYQEFLLGDEILPTFLT